MDASNGRRCEVLLKKLRDAERKVQKTQTALFQAEGAMAVAQGRITAAESSLQRIIDQISSTGASGVGCATLDKRDCVVVAIRLAREQASHEDKVTSLKRALRDKQFKLNALRKSLSLDRNNVQRIISLLNATGC